MQTYTGRAFYPLDPRPQDVAIDDIAHALAHLCRYGGHSRFFYSVAEHSLLLARYAAASPDMAPKDAADLALCALLHDASEAYLVDVPRPLKIMLPLYAVMEARVQAAIAARFGLSHGLSGLVRDLDHRILTDERLQLMETPPQPWATDAEPLGVIITGMSPRRAEREFLDEFHRLRWGAR
ncbi:phosphohydrolase [Methylosinus trichosporium OB3b]|uniref:Phosphohydrolase n=2 Tax=Methylocystaceae TaxID=31993 RepID=A0A2D2CYD2_METT3|nr:phosphohydrolase [Methylosinus trichosporium OB3b]OBS51143.1 hypothetical protein A8B73_17625 [Methylosinus sp. 3S-1]